MNANNNPQKSGIRGLYSLSGVRIGEASTRQEYMRQLAAMHSPCPLFASTLNVTRRLSLTLSESAQGTTAVATRSSQSRTVQCCQPYRTSEEGIRDDMHYRYVTWCNIPLTYTRHSIQVGFNSDSATSASATVLQPTNTATLCFCAHPPTCRRVPCSPSTLSSWVGRRPRRRDCCCCCVCCRGC